MNPAFWMQNMFGTRSELALVFAMVGILLVLFTPIPALLLDFLLILNISISLLILLLSFYIDRPLAFSTFPSILLIATLFRLSLNIASTRLILEDGYAGDVINAIGEHVVGGNYVIGLVVFAILIVVQYVVVTSGAQRVAEVAARFTLDSMPGKQMSIDADLNMGLIGELEARERRKNVEREANFYGAMDGASKFVKGDAIAGIIIVLINIVGGLTVGLAQRGLSWGEALHSYTLLTVGDGIVTQIPALVISVATGIIVTRAATDAMFGEEIARQIARYPKSLVVVGIGLSGLLLLPGVPWLPVLVILVLTAVGAYFAFQAKERVEAEDAAPQVAATGSEQDLYQDIQVDPIEIFAGDNLVELIGKDSGQFMDRIRQFRKQFAMEMGFVFPPVKIKDSYSGDSTRYRISMYGAKIDEGELFPHALLAISPTEKRQPLEGIETKDPTYGLPAVWINEDQRQEARKKNYTLVDPLTVIVTHFSEIVRNHAPELLTRSEAERLLTRVRSSQPALVEELIPGILSLSDVQHVLQQLLAEKVSIRNIELIIEALIEHGRANKNVDELAEKVRSALARCICESLLDKDGRLQVVTLEPQFEQMLIAGVRQTESRSTLVVDPMITERLIKQLSLQAEKMMARSMRPVLLVSPSLRRHVRKLVARVLPLYSVLSLSEIPSTVHIASFAVVQMPRDERKPLAVPAPVLED